MYSKLKVITMDPSVWSEAKTSYDRFLHSDIEYACEYCQIAFQSESILFRHVNEVHRVASWKYTADNPHYATSGQGKACGICGEEMATLGKHLEGKHTGMPGEVYFMRYVFRSSAETTSDQRRKPVTCQSKAVEEESALHHTNVVEDDLWSFASSDHEEAPTIKAEAIEGSETENPEMRMKQRKRKRPLCETDEGGKRTFTCTDCDYKSDNASRLTSHIRVR